MNINIGQGKFELVGEGLDNISLTNALIGKSNVALLNQSNLGEIDAINALVKTIYQQQIDGIECPENTYPVPCSIPGHEGYILLPQSPSGRLFVEYFQAEKKHVKDDNMPLVYDKLYLMGMFVLEWHLNGIKDHNDFLKNPLDYGAALPYFIWDNVQHVLRRVTTLKN